MRKNHNGDSVFETLGEYYSFCVLIGGKDCEAAHFLMEKIDAQGMDTKVIADHSQMMMLLHPMIFNKGKDKNV